jgi:hypothetical protein
MQHVRLGLVGSSLEQGDPLQKQKVSRTLYMKHLDFGRPASQVL